MKRIRLLKALAVLFTAAGALLAAAGFAVQLLVSRSGYAGSTMTETAEFAAPRELTVITTSMPITVRYGDTDTVKVEYTGALPLIFSEETKGTLSITQNDTFTMTLFSDNANKEGVTVTLPHKVYERISLSSSGGSVTSDHLSAGILEYSTKGGDMRLLGIDETASVRTESGSIYAEFSAFNDDMTLNAGAGDVTLVMPEDLSVYLEFFTESGSFTSDRFDEPYHARYGDAAVIYGGARSRLNVNTTSGDLYIY
ncbi:MAG: DUF4097 family beta strand repeat protein [Ruminiclostridium sp.]|nr:DUF4097 family beta strand repeat protein [Ruminiclostridium sp.]